MSAAMDTIISGALARAEVLEETLNDLGRLGARFRTRDGLVTAEVNARGGLIALELSENIATLTPAEAGQLIVWACAQAARQVGADRTALITRMDDELAELNH